MLTPPEEEEEENRIKILRTNLNFDHQEKGYFLSFVHGQTANWQSGRITKGRPCAAQKKMVTIEEERNIKQKTWKNLLLLLLVDD